MRRMRTTYVPGPYRIAWSVGTAGPIQVLRAYICKAHAMSQLVAAENLMHATWVMAQKLLCSIARPEEALQLY